MSVKRQILLRMGTVLVICLIVAAMSAALIFFNQAKAQIAETQESRLLQTAVQLDYLFNEMHSFADNMAIDKTLQKVMFDDAYENYSDGGKAFLASSQMRNYKAQRDNIQSIALITADKKVIWGEIAYDRYFAEKMEEPWYQNIKDGKMPVCSVPHMLTNRDNLVSEVVSYVIPVYNINYPGNARGYMIINIYLDYFISQIDLLGSNFEQVVWKQNDNIIYRQNENFDESVNEENMNHVRVARGFTELDAHYEIPLVSFFSIPSLITLLLIILSLIVLGIFVMFPVARSITRPLANLANEMNNVVINDKMFKDEMPVKIRGTEGRHIAGEINMLNHAFEEMILELRRQMQQRSESERKTQRLSTELILSQVNPHFLYNTLNTIIYLSRKGSASDIEQITQNLILLLQQSITFENRSPFHKLRDELEIVRQYATIQKYRYKDMFSLSIDVPEELLDCMVPRFVIQPLVENSIFHGISPKNEYSVIWISAEYKEECLFISISDDGIGMPEKKILDILSDEEEAVDYKKSIGLRNIRARLNMLYGDNAGININSQPGQGCTVVVKIKNVSFK